MRYIWTALATLLIFPLLIKKKKKEEAIINRQDLFNTALNRDELRIRYLFLDDKKKSGDAILIQSPDGFTMLIDSGKVSTGDQLNRYLDELGIDEIDLAVATHPHHDHIGGYHTILQTKKIKKMVMPDIPHHTPILDVFNDLIDKKEINTEILEDGNIFKLGSELEFEVLNPPKGTHSDQFLNPLTTAEINDLSLVLKMIYKNKTFLFTADLYVPGEESLLERHYNNLQADFFEAPHHGAATSSTKELIEAVDPEMVVLNANILQSRVILARYKNQCDNVFPTALHGNVLVTSNGENLKIYTEK